MAKVTAKEAGSADTAENKAGAKQGQEPVKEQKALQEPAGAQEAVYLADELAAHARGLFGTRQECVAAALKAAGKTGCTVAEAKELVGKFLNREVE